MNTLTVHGNLTDTPELRHGSSGNTVFATFSVAVSVAPNWKCQVVRAEDRRRARAPGGGPVWIRLQAARRPCSRWRIERSSGVGARRRRADDVGPESAVRPR
jgi:single-stranded DNA-binding protein